MNRNHPPMKSPANWERPSGRESEPDPQQKKSMLTDAMEDLKKLKVQSLTDLGKLAGKEQELSEKKLRIRKLEAELYNQRLSANQLQKQAELQRASITQLQNQLEAARREAAQYRAEAALAEQYRQLIWDLVVQSGAVADYFIRQNRDYGKLCKHLYRDIQYVLGNLRIGEDWEDLRRDLRKSLHRFYEARCREDELAQLPERSLPPLTWMPEPERERMQDALQECIRPDRSFRLLTEKLLVFLETGEGKELPELLRSCGIQVLYYEDAPWEVRDTAFFGFYENGMELPALVGQRFGESRLKVLARGAHVG